MISQVLYTYNSWFAHGEFPGINQNFRKVNEKTTKTIEQSMKTGSSHVKTKTVQMTASSAPTADPMNMMQKHAKTMDTRGSESNMLKTLWK